MVTGNTFRLLASKATTFSILQKLSTLEVQQLRRPVLADEFAPSAENTVEGLVDAYGRRHTYLRISVAEKCNLRCTYCMPEEGVPLNPSHKLLSADEIVRIATIFAANGVTKIRLTGGEPTLRKDIVDIVGRLSVIPGIEQVGMTTNGIALPQKLEALVDNGLKKLNISLDTLNEAKYMIMTRRNGFKKVIKSINLAESMFDQVKINNVIIRGINDDELIDFVALTQYRKLDIRFIEYMPFGGNKFEVRKMVPYREMLKVIDKSFPMIIKLKDQPNDTSKAYSVHGFRGKIGFISSMSEHFCSSCNRLRVTSDGNLKRRLTGRGKRHSIRDNRSRGTQQKKETACWNGTPNKYDKSTNGPYRRLKKFDCAPSQLPCRRICNSYFYFLSKNFSSSTNLIFKDVLIKRFIHTASVQRIEQLSHVSNSGKANMVDVTKKAVTIRTAIAQCVLKVNADVMRAILHNEGQKGDALGVARIAGIQAAKRTSSLIPLCHNIFISNVQISFHLNQDKNEVLIRSMVHTKAETGVEMEALTAVTVAALTLYDMCKAITHNMIITEVRLVGKSGGKRDFGERQL
ncbi:Molybdenum cofactor biosynthesis protein 1 [Toxocara canis]|uniref:Molybdenum cofactor biosynthesis protein 1 n=1 Tax=Toxocara canis TaxID=6265 RepID=A0A0B2UNN5_TOXCA|nr:Molybdenum cofactor biosynthesis protein 1 [Toxocara canis]